MKLTTESGQRFAPAQLAVAVGATLVASIVAVVVIRAVAVALVDVPEAFMPLKASSAISLTVIGVLAAGLACLTLNRIARRPIDTFRRVAPVALVVSFVPDIAIWAGGAYDGTASASTVLPLMVMHVAVAALCITLLPALGHERAGGVAPASAAA